MEKPSFFERANNWVRGSVTLRLVTIGILILILLIPVSMVESVIWERKSRSTEAQREVSDKWSRSQTIVGPVLTVPYSEYTKVKDSKNDTYRLVETVKNAHFFPDELNINGTVTPEERYRGIYKAVVYSSDVDVAAVFGKPDFSSLKIDPKDAKWEDAYISVGIEDLRGIQNSVKVDWNGDESLFEPGTGTDDVLKKGISAKVKLDSSETTYKANININLNGSSDMAFIPIGRTTKVQLNSTWPSPSFSGAFLPDEREVTKDGFTANWEVLHLNREFPQSFKGSTSGLNSSAFSVDFIVTVDQYQKNTRSAKYAVMFISLTFVIIFFIQIMNKVRVHPIQYLIIGLSLCVFYTLLIGLSEHIPFELSYLIAAVTIVGMITAYGHGMFKSLKITGLIFSLVTALYLFIFTIVQMEDFALLMGSIGLVVVLALVMYLSRKIDWYNISEQ